LKPVTRFLRLVSRERADLCLLATYTLVVIVMTLAVPLATQSLVNTIAAGMFLQPVVLLSFLVLGGLSVAGLVQLLQYGVVETVQQRVFAHTALALADRMLNVRAAAMRTHYAPELVNRFFDVITIQKALSKLLLDGFTAFIQTIVTVLVLGIYNPGLLLSAVTVLVLFFGGTILLGYGGIKSSLYESKQKYIVAEWLQDIARCHLSLKLYANRESLSSKTDELVTNYILARRSHFRVNRRQLGGFFAFAALASAGVLGTGGWLVLNGSLTVGQLVAAQIIVTTSLASLEKLIRQSEKYFDLLAGLDKVAVISELETERDGGKELPALHPAGALVELKNLHFEYDNGHKVLNGLNLTIHAGDRVSLVGASGAGKSTLAAVLCGFQSPSMGDAIFDNVDIREACLQRLRAQVSLAGYEPDVFHGTIEENIRVGRDEISSADLRWAVTTAELDDDLAAIPGGLQAELVSGGQNISRGQLQRLLIARAILGKPRLLILDEALTGIDERISQRILDNIFEASNPWTIIDISHQPDVILKTDKVHVMAEGQIVESGSPTQLAQSAKSVFSELFPFLSANLRAGTARIGGGK